MSRYWCSSRLITTPRLFRRRSTILLRTCSLFDQNIFISLAAPMRKDFNARNKRAFMWERIVEMCSGRLQKRWSEQQHLANITGWKRFIVHVTSWSSRAPCLGGEKLRRMRVKVIYWKTSEARRKKNWLFDQIAPIDWVNIEVTSSVSTLRRNFYCAQCVTNEVHAGYGFRKFLIRSRENVRGRKEVNSDAIADFNNCG